MNYGNLESALEFDKNNKIEEWIQLFLRNDGDNLPLADGLLLEERCYTGIIDFDLNKLHNVKSGAPEYFHDEESISHFFDIVNNMKAELDKWNPPPMIIEFKSDGTFYVCDGRHRLEAYRQLGINRTKAVCWATGEENFTRLLEALNK
ncbi:MAG: ParB N-terminal domain-containing protein [Clostridia bacterium]|nr:ParB N-terminal domain-containing protein [Clostridia bacterium]